MKQAKNTWLDSVKDHCTDRCTILQHTPVWWITCHRNTLPHTVDIKVPGSDICFGNAEGSLDSCHTRHTQTSSGSKSITPVLPNFPLSSYGSLESNWGLLQAHLDFLCTTVAFNCTDKATFCLVVDFCCQKLQWLTSSNEYTGKHTHWSSHWDWFVNQIMWHPSFQRI